MTRRLTSNTLILLANNMGSAGLAFLISVIIGRGLGPSGLGQYAFIMAWIAPLVALADFGMGSLITRDVAKNPACALPTLRTATRVLLPIAGTILLLAWAVVPFLGAAPVVTIAMPIAALLIILDPWYGLYTALFRAFQWMWPILVINVGGLALQLILTALAVYGGAGLIGVAVVLAGINIVQLIVTWVLWRTRGPLADRFTMKDSLAIGMRDVLRRAWPFALAAVLNALQLRLNVLLLEHLSGDVAVGLYSAANRFVEAGRLVPGALFGALFPLLASLAAVPDQMRQTFLKATGLILTFAVIFGLSMTLFGGWLIHLTYDARGTGFGGATPVLTVLAWSLVPALMRSILTLYLYSLGREQFVNVVTMIALGAQAVLGWLLIGRWGAIGAALTVGIVEGGTTLWFALTMRIAPQSR